MRYWRDDWLEEDEGNTGYYFLITLASKLSKAPSLSSRESITPYFEQLRTTLEQIGWQLDDIFTLINGHKLRDMITFHGQESTLGLLEQPHFLSLIRQSGAGWLSPTHASTFHDKLQQIKHKFDAPSNHIESVKRFIVSGFNPVPVDVLKQVYQHAMAMLEASIESNQDLLLIMD